MAALTQTKTGAFKSRQRVPKDVADEYARLYGQRHEVKLHIPGGATERQAKKRHAEWIAEHEGRVDAIRKAQRGEGIDLSHKEALGLAGEWYTWFVARHEEAPGDPERWNAALRALWEALEEHAPDDVRTRTQHDLEWARDPEVRAGIRPALADIGHTSQFLAGRGIGLTNSARALFLDCVLDNYVAAVDLLEQRARGDYSPDERPQQFPPFAQRVSTASTGLTSWALFEAWIKAKQPAVMTIESWRAVFKALDRHFESRAADSIKPDEAQAWIVGLVNETRSARTVRNTWVRAAKAVFRWAKGRKVIARDAFAAVEIDVPRQKRSRETKAFHEHELRTILRAAGAVPDEGRQDDAARRWVPWLLAYAGARPNEITQLRGCDVQRVDGIWTVYLTPDAGSIKTGKARRVPLHEHVLEQGFLDFVKACGEGPLFYRQRVKPSDAEPTKQRKPPAAQVRQRLAAWVRSLGVNDTELSPNHGWRHTFKQIATREGLSEKVVDSICGHSPASEGRAYGEPTLKDKADTLAKFPRYATGDASDT